MENLSQYKSRTTALIIRGSKEQLDIGDEWNLTDLDLSVENLGMWNGRLEPIEALFSNPIAGLTRFYPDKHSRLVGVFGKFLLDQSIVAQIQEKYQACGYDTVTLTQDGKLESYRPATKCKVILRRYDGR